jgi:hypothetical protein
VLGRSVNRIVGSPVSGGAAERRTRAVRREIRRPIRWARGRIAGSGGPTPSTPCPGRTVVCLAPSWLRGRAVLRKLRAAQRQPEQRQGQTGGQERPASGGHPRAKAGQEPNKVSPWANPPGPSRESGGLGGRNGHGQPMGALGWRHPCRSVARSMRTVLVQLGCTQRP